MIIINGKKYTGNNLSISNNEVFIDGKRMEDDEDSKSITIQVEGNIETITADYCDSMSITGTCGNVTSKNGNIDVIGDVLNDVTTKNGNIHCGHVAGDVETKNGNITKSNQVPTCVY